ncbi:type III pantothenate kinase [Brachyspira hyodysenteriae]|uniref:type III pantothenate kinase n=1 Tax=Brachyspira hyodysenteriae TaxID=159 RepID=UPI00063DB559|nr:type III pantothenate kinase [Brachyspira hyodysenteriae]KLI31458.1 pantothenate kinase [Brachyspira hyodysenteriae]KLI52017.1 pantothenate kinase [Brachyspira hyodysenteriae]KLI59799.1 pantothenate kinase [Brachyspira hyodysenteriae]MCZ9891891.1 type III pantothenate kinase [Brachyspira hyodysenteriae]MCZ9955950.1 type III pantothenate kinase [Brachyspira hyodysenteriae]
MYLLSDIGNTRAKLAIFEEKNCKPLYYKAIEHSNALDLVSALNEIKNNHTNIKQVFYSSVSLKVNDLFEGSVEDCFNMKPYRVTHNDIELKGNSYEPKDSVGIDRILSTYASICLEKISNSNEEKYASVVIDMGTATTVSIMISDFTFLGGMIIAGTKTSYQALSNVTSLPYYEIGPIESIPNPINNNVKDAIMSGAIYNTIGTVNYAVSETKKYIKSKYNIKCKIFLTGGISNLKLLKCKVYPFLVLQGIYFNMIAKNK